jgi:hypothetical protein
MLGELEALPPKPKLLTTSLLLDMAIKNSYRAPIAYLAPQKQKLSTIVLKKAIKVKGLELFELYAESYYKEQAKE